MKRDKIFVSFHLVYDWNLLLHMNIAVTYYKAMTNLSSTAAEH